MSVYVLSVMGTVLLCALLTAILPTGKTTSIVKGVSRLACVISIVMPVLVFFQSGKWSVNQNIFQNDFAENVIQTDDAFIKYYSEMRVHETQTALEQVIYEEFSVQAEIVISWEIYKDKYADDYEWQKIKITNIHVKNKEKQTEEVERAMWVYLTENYCSEVLIE